MIVIIDYGIGNLGSIANALTKLGVKYQISSDPVVVEKAKALILPGVGAAKEGMRKLKKRKLDKLIMSKIKDGLPFLGICLGMQLLFDFSEEGNTKCLGVLKGIVKRFQLERKVPQIGWNQILYKKLNIKNQKCKFKIKNLLREIDDESYFYFVNSYYCIPEDQSIVVGTSEYGEKFASIIVKDNILATQFHPEKSSKVGFQLLENFMKSIP